MAEKRITFTVNAFCVFLCITSLIYDTQTMDNYTESPTGLPTNFETRTLPPPVIFLSLTYSVNESYSDFDTLIEANSFACGRHHFCNSSHGEYERALLCLDCQPCQCDTLCHYYGDCCADLGGTQKKLSLPWTCVKRTDKSKGQIGMSYALMVATCPTNSSKPEYHANARSRCEESDETNIADKTPVTDPMTNVTYRNRFCALCHGITGVTSWTFSVECEVGTIKTTDTSREELFRSVVTSNTCTIRDVPPPDVYVRTCMDDYVTVCDVNQSSNYSKVAQKLCHSSYGPPINIGGKTYSNVFCALCNGIVLDRYCKANSRRLLDFAPLPGLDVVLDLNPKSSKSSENYEMSRTKASCPLNQLYDPITDSCLPIHCPPRRLYADGVCEPVYTSADSMGYELSLQVLTSYPVPTTHLLGLVFSYETQLKKSLEMYEPFRTYTAQYQTILRNVSSSDGDATEALGFYLHISLVLSSSDSLSQTEEVLRVLSKQVYDFPVGDRNVSLEAQTIQCLLSLSEDVPGLLVEDNRELGHLEHCGYYQCLFEFVPIFSTLNCPQIHVNLSGIQHIYNSQTYTISVKNRTIELDQNSHVYCGDMLSLCREVLFSIQQQLEAKQNGSPIGIVSVVCISLSLICLLLTFVVFCLIPQLRTLPGKNTMALILHLFCAQLLFQSGISATDNVDVCRTMGVLIHYFWLTTFAWMAVSAYHMYSAFTNMSLISSSGGCREHIQRLVKYTAICHGLAAIFVFGCLGYNLGSSSGKDYGYGPDICFLNDTFDKGLFFAAPLGVILVFNTVCFVKTILAIRSVPDMKLAKNKANKTHLDAYFRLSVLLGFTWGVGYVASALQSDVFWYLFVILNGLQGVFIAVAFCCNRRTMDMLKVRLGQAPQTTTTHSTSLPASTGVNSRHIETTKI